jgi:hypothetical protein
LILQLTAPLFPWQPVEEHVAWASHPCSFRLKASSSVPPASCRLLDLLPALDSAFQSGNPTLVDCPVDYDENLKLTERLGKLVCPI